MRRHSRLAALLVLLIATGGVSLGAYWLTGQSWATGVQSIYIQLGSAGTLIDGCADWSCSATSAINRWNVFLGGIQLRAVPNATQGQGERNGRNDMFFASDVYGRSFGANTLALSLWWYQGSSTVEGDIGFNTAKQWNSYRGAQRTNGATRVFDLRRVAIHELGHIIGLDHPDEHGQNVTALMNSILGDLDDLANDDIAGAQAMYGGGSGATINFPPRNETNDFRNWLEAKYRTDMGRAPGQSYTDTEGSVVWIQEYLRYRLNMCTHDQALDRVRVQISGGGILGVCGTPPSTSVINFPPRNETYGFRLQLEALYKDELKRSTVSTSVDAEGDVVWIQEYVRYRLNKCTHAVAVDKVNTQINGGGIPAVCG